jgi:hypothetical protein
MFHKGEGVLLNFVGLCLLDRLARGGDESMTLLEVISLLSLITSVAARARAACRFPALLFAAAEGVHSLSTPKDMPRSDRI